MSFLLNFLLVVAKKLILTTSIVLNSQHERIAKVQNDWKRDLGL